MGHIPCCFTRACAAGTTVVYDPQGMGMQGWAPLEGDLQALQAAVTKLPSERVCMQPGQVMFMKSPVPHEVSHCVDRATGQVIWKLR